MSMFCNLHTVVVIVSSAPCVCVCVCEWFGPSAFPIVSLAVVHQFEALYPQDLAFSACRRSNFRCTALSSVVAASSLDMVLKVAVSVLTWRCVPR